MCQAGILNFILLVPGYAKTYEKQLNDKKFKYLTDNSRNNQEGNIRMGMLASWSIFLKRFGLNSFSNILRL